MGITGFTGVYKDFLGYTRVYRDIQGFSGVYLTIIPLAHVGYEMMDSQ